MAAPTNNMPVPPDTLFANLFSDVLKDPHYSNYEDLYAHFLLDMNDLNNNVGPNIIKQQLVATGSQHSSLMGCHPTSCTHDHGSRSRQFSIHVGIRI